MGSTKSIEQVKSEWESRLMATAGVMGVGIGLMKDRKRKAIKVFVNRKDAAIEQNLPSVIEGYPVEIVTRGTFRALKLNLGRIQMSTATARDLVRVMRTARPLFEQLVRATHCDCVNGFGITQKRVQGKRVSDQPAIVFYVNKKLSLRNLPIQNRIPKQINLPWEHGRNGVLEIVTDVQVQQFQSLEYTSRERPCPGGYSIGHVDITAGTLGCLVKDKLNDNTVILSNNHVMANSNQAAIGDPIVQPGPTDGGTVQNDQIATLTRFKPIDFTAGVNNLIDAAIATPLEDVPDLVEFAIKDVGSGVPTETRNIGVDDLGDSVHKTGRTTEHTSGYIDTVNATVQVKYGLGEKATCHTLTSEAKYADAFAGRDPTIFASNFSRLPVATCAKCHRPGHAGDACLLCHQYHVGVFTASRVPTEMVVGEPAPQNPPE